MMFLFPAMLAGLAGLTIPVAIHLIARHRFPVREFPSVRLLAQERRNNVFAWRLVDPLQLLLRLLVLLLLVLAMARLFLPGFGRQPAPRNVVVVVDASASMGQRPPAGSGPSDDTLLAAAAREAAAILGTIRAPGQATLLVAGERLQVLRHLEGDPAALAATLRTLQPAAGAGVSLVHAAAEACDLLRGRHEVQSQVVLISDCRASAFETRSAADLAALAAARQAMGRRLELRLVDVSGGLKANVAVAEARLRGGAVRLGDDAHVLTRVVNHGAEPVDATLRLTVLGRAVPAAPPVPLEPGGEAIVDLTVPVGRAANGFADVALREGDALPLDDRAFVPFRVSDTVRVLLVHDAAPPPTSALDRLGQASGGGLPADSGEAIDGARILRYVLNPARESGGNASTGIDTTLVTPETFATQPLSKYDLIALYDVDTLPESALADLETFVRQGKAVLAFASAQCNPVRFNRIFGALAPGRIGNERALATPVGVDLTALDHPVLAPFTDRSRGDLATLRFLRVRELQPEADATVLLRADDGSPLAIERPLEFGRVVLCAFGLELDRATIARTRVFPVFTWRLVDYLTDRLRPRPPDLLTAGRPAVLDAGETPFAFETELELAAAGSASQTVHRLLPIRTGRTVLVGTLPEPLPVGAYQLRKVASGAGAAVAWGYGRGIVVNPDPRESHMDLLPDADLTALFGADARRLRAAELQASLPRGRELYGPLLLFLLLAYLAEAAFGWFFSARRERERRATEAEGAVA